ncbi:MAG: DNA gyrase inhibitor YacG [Rhizomicrobium sp.]
MSRPLDGGQCPICGRPRDVQFRPFCSKRCADIDLMHWLKGEYTIPGAPASDENINDPYEDDDAG